ncbi:hypothetical protein ACROYT_G001008 [Oculina patagonica]
MYRVLQVSQGCFQLKDLNKSNYQIIMTMMMMMMMMIYDDDNDDDDDKLTISVDFNEKYLSESGSQLDIFLESQ